LEEEKVTSIDDDLIESTDAVDNIISSDIVEAEETVVDPFLDQTNGVLVMGGEEERLQMDEVPVESAEPGAMVKLRKRNNQISLIFLDLTKLFIQVN